MCATPPHLEGATLQQIPLGSLNCDGNVNKINNANVLQQLEIRSKQTNLTYDTKFSYEVYFKRTIRDLFIFEIFIVYQILYSCR